MFLIFKYPRATIRFCLMFKPLIYFCFIGIVGAFSSELAQFVNTKYQFQFTLGDIVSSSMATSVILFVISTLLGSTLLHFLGKLVGGKGKFKLMFRALCLTYIPYIWILPMLLFWMQLSPESYFIISGAEQSGIDQFMKYFGPLLILIASLWSIFLALKVIQEVHRISLLKSFGTLILMGITGVVLAIALSVGFSIQLI